MPVNLLQNPSAPSLAVLDWAAILQPLLDLTHFKANQQYWLGPFTLQRPEDLENNYKTLDFFQEHHTAIDPLLTATLKTMDEEKEIDFAAWAKGLLATWPELHLAAQFLETFLAMQSTFAELTHLDETDHQALQTCQKHFLPPFRELVLANGEIDYLHHPQLAEIFQQQQALAQVIRQQLHNLTLQEPFASALQYEEHDCVQGNFVLAIKADHYQSSLGSIIARSHRGNTLLVAPLAIRHLNRQWEELENQQQEVLLRLQYHFNDLLRPYTALLTFIQHEVYAWDRYAAAAAYARQLDLVRPTLNQEFSLEIKGFFHPLIAHPVKNDFFLAATQQGLILSGPNTGGKTVVLKSIALIYLFMYRGLYVPAQQAKLFPLSNLYYIALDQQDLSAELSSFAAEAQNYLSLLHELGPQNLIIIDEIFNSTSSEDASALAMALLSFLAKRENTKVILSTHHQILKTFMHQDKRYLSARMDFDPTQHRPTYHLVTGAPGASLALEIMQRMAPTYPAATQIVQTAAQFMEQKQVAYEKLLQDLAQQSHHYQQLIDQQTVLNQQLKNQFDAQQGLLVIERQKALASFTKQLSAVQEQAEKLIDRLRRGDLRIRGAQRELSAVKGQIINLTEQIQPAATPPPSGRHLNFEEIKLDERYYIVSLGVTGIVIQKDAAKEEVVLRAKKTKWRCTAEDLLTLDKKANPKKPAPQVQVFLDAPLPDVQLNGRGMRLAEFQTAAMEAITAFENEQIPFLTIIHGHGTGALKSWLRQYLKERHLAYTCENNDGVTCLKHDK